jgi:hypothetical protein
MDSKRRYFRVIVTFTNGETYRAGELAPEGQVFDQFPNRLSPIRNHAPGSYCSVLLGSRHGGGLRMDIETNETIFFISRLLSHVALRFDLPIHSVTRPANRSRSFHSD